MGIPAWGISFGPGTNDPSNGYYNVDATGGTSISSIVQAVIDDATLCPAPTTYPTSGIGAGGTCGGGQVLHFDGRGIYKVGTTISIGNKSIRVEGNGCAFTNDNTTNPNRIMWQLTGGGYGSPFIHMLTMRNFVCNNGYIKGTAGHKPRMLFENVWVTDLPNGYYGFNFGQQSYWMTLLRCGVRRCGGGINGPGLSSDLCLIEDFDVAWCTDLPDINVNSSGTRILRGDFEARQYAYYAVPHIQVYPNNPTSDPQSYCIIDGAHFGGEVDSNEYGMPPAYCIVIGDAATVETDTSVVRSRVIIRNCMVTVNQDSDLTGNSTGPSAQSSNGFLNINAPIQECRLLYNDFTQANYTLGKGFHGYAIQSGYAESSNYVTNSHSNYYRGNQLARIQANGLFSPRASLGWLPF